MFGLRKSKPTTLAELSEKEIIAVANACSQDLSNSYLFFRSKLKFKDGTKFEDILEAFRIPAVEFVRLNYPSVYATGHTGTFFRLMLSAIELTDLDDKADVHRAAKRLGILDEDEQG